MNVGVIKMNYIRKNMRLSLNLEPMRRACCLTVGMGSHTT